VFTQLVLEYKKDEVTPKHITDLKKRTLTAGNKAVPVLIEVMKSSSYPERKRWMATFMLTRIMGDKAAPFIARFTDHPHWMMRTAGLKSLLILKEKKYAPLYVKALNDPALIVRVQALDNIRTLGLNACADDVWRMMFNPGNYTGGPKGKKISNLIKSVIRTSGEFKHSKARKAFVSMINKDRYNAVFDDLDYALSKSFGVKSPTGNKNARRAFWNKKAARG
jgi:HEAT repeat protein